MFPEFDPGKEGVLFFSRGRGRGHAVPDIEIARELLKRRPEVDLRFVSYASGAKAIEEAGFPLIDLDLPELNPYTLTTVLAGKLIGWLRPELVVAHEEFAAMPAAKIFDRRTVFLTDWFVAPDRAIMHALQFADEILFLEDAGIFDEPEYLDGHVRYLGPYRRAFRYTREDRVRARRELDLPEEAVVISVLPGSYATEERVPSAGPVLEAFDRLPFPCKRLVWVAGTDAPLLSEKTRGRSDVLIREFDPLIERIMAASDAAVTKANRKTVLELDELGVPSVALCPGMNPVDEARLARLDRVIRLPLGEASGERLCAALLEVLGMPWTRGPRPPGSSAAAIASILSRNLRPVEAAVEVP